MTAITVGGTYPARHAKPRPAGRVAAITITGITTAAALAAVALTAYQMAAYQPDCTHWVNPAHVGWPHSTCDTQTRPAPTWWHGTEPQP